MSLSRIMLGAVCLSAWLTAPHAIASEKWPPLPARDRAVEIPASYPDPTDLSHFRDRAGRKHPIKTVADWEVRRRHVLDNVQRVMGPFPSQLRRVPLEVKL